MPTLFKSLEASVNSAIVKILANQTLTINGLNVDGVFLNEYDEVGFVESSNPAFVAKESDLQLIEHGMDAYSADGTKYQVVGIKPDGTGMKVLELHVEWHT